MELAISQSRPQIGIALKVLIGSLILGLAAQFSVWLPFSPVPIALTNSVALALGIYLGPRAGALAVIAYLIEGLNGVPVFSNGHSGFLWMAGPTGGYLIGFALGAFVTGWLGKGGALRKFGAILAGSAVIYFCGVAHLAQFVGLGKAITIGVLPFIPGDLIKALAFASLLRNR